MNKDTTIADYNYALKQKLYHEEQAKYWGNQTRSYLNAIDSERVATRKKANKEALRPTGKINNNQ